MAAIETRNLGKRYGKTEALHGVNLVVEQGEIYGLVGPNGAGKTTTLGIACGFVRPSSGSVTVLGIDSSKLHRLRGRIGALPQDALLPGHERVIDTLVFTGRLMGWSSRRARREAEAALQRTGMFASAHSFCGTLSHGMAKRVGLALAFLGSPDLVILDEPTAGLDPVAAAQARELIRDLHGECTVVMSSHEIHELELLCDSLAILAKGRVVQAGSVRSLTGADTSLRFVLGPGAPPLPVVRDIVGVLSVDFDQRRRTLLVRFDGTSAGPDELLPKILDVLLRSGIGIESASRGRGLEDRILEMA